MKTLYIDTTTSYLYSGISIDGRLVSEIKEDLGKNLSSQALNKISIMLSDNNLKPKDIDKIIVVNGPGSFTGIRVGITIAKTFAYSLKKEITTVTSLEVMAMSSKDSAPCKIPLIDARRNYVYAAIYKTTPVLKEQYISLEALKCAQANLIEESVYISNQTFDGIECEKYDPDIEKIINIVEKRESVNPHSVNPVYLKSTEAEEKHKLELI